MNIIEVHMRGLVVTRTFPGVPSLEADMAAGRLPRSGEPTFAQRGEAICRQALGHTEGDVLLRTPPQDASDAEMSEYYTAELETSDWFKSDRLDEPEFINLFMTWGFDLTDGRGRRLKSYIYFYRVMEGLARNALILLPIPKLEPLRQRRIAGSASGRENKVLFRARVGSLHG